MILRALTEHKLRPNALMAHMEACVISPVPRVKYWRRAEVSLHYQIVRAYGWTVRLTAAA